MFEARLARNLQASPKYWLFFQSDLHVFRHTVRYLPQLAFDLRNWNNSTHACRKPWRAWKKTLEILRGSNPLGERFWSAYWGRRGATCWWNILSNSPVWESHWWVSAVFEKSMGYLWIFFHCNNRYVSCIFINQIQVVVSNLLLNFQTLDIFSTFQASLRRFLPIWMPPTHLVLS